MTLFHLNISRWDDEMIRTSLALRNMDGMTVATVKRAMKEASHIVFVCEKQRLLYAPTAPSSVSLRYLLAVIII